MASSHKLLMCVDFGTYGFFVSYAHPTNPGRAQAVGDWPRMPDTDYGKNLNAILLRKSNPEEILGYGFEARELYMAAKEGDRHRDMMYFENFKLQLLQTEAKEFDTDKEILAIDNTSTRTLCPLVSQCLSKIVEHSLRYYEASEAPISLDEVLWVVTVPAIWPLVSREAMKQCCVQIGMEPENVTIISEPEAAGSYLVWGTDEGLVLGEEDAYVCLDVGSGTFDIVCHELGDGRMLNELHYADGGRKGAFDVDKAFERLLEDLVGQEIMDELRENVPTEFVTQMQEFQRAREKIRCDDSQKFVSLCEELEEMVSERGLNLKEICRGYRISADDDEEVVTFRKGKLTIRQKLWEHLHKSAVETISNRVRELLGKDELEGVRRLFLVGGFSKSAYVQRAMSMLALEFDGIELIAPRRPELAVARGGLWFAAKRTIATRLLPCTYGICVEREWDSRRGDPVERRVVDPDFDTYKIGDVFHILFEKEEEWETGRYENFEYGIGPGVKTVEIDLYTSEEQYPCFVDEVGCVKQATFEFELPEEDVCAHAQKLKMRCFLTEDSMEMRVFLQNIHGRESHPSPFKLRIGRRE